MLLKIAEVKNIFYNVLIEEILKEDTTRDDVTATQEMPFDTEKTQISNFSNNRSHVPFERATHHAKKVSPERRAWILSNLDSINPLPGGDLTDDERIFYVLTKAEMFTSDLEAKMKIRKKEEEERRERENLAHIERIKNRYASSGDVEGTAVLAGNSGYRPDYEDTISIPFIDDEDTI